MENTELKKKIGDSIKSFNGGDLFSNSLEFFNLLGYKTERQNKLRINNYKGFINDFPDALDKMNTEKSLVKEWKSIDLLFQLTETEMIRQSFLFDTKKVDNTIIEAYLFFAIDLKEGDYTRTQLSGITRELNKVFHMPVMILFKNGNLLTLSVINRRLHKRDESKDVLEKVTLIKDISIDSPHRAHVEILYDLTFDELKKKYEFTNFVELHNAWQKTLDTKELNNKFFKELSNWYFWAQKYVSFPNDIKLNEKKNKQINLIRLITRLIFVWFIKEKNLVNEKLFDINFLKNILKIFDPDSKKANDYYPAILQNLFFATLNQKMSERDFVKEGSFVENKEHYGVKSLYRYSSLFNIKEKEIVQLFKDIPFLNGGLFDCLDKENEESGKIEYVDGFSRNNKKIPQVPDILFFGEEVNVDLSGELGNKRKKETCTGIINIFNNYKFTIEENTPIEEEIALDPELLGKVFESLLAYYNPETETTARKQTGSFYTPREIVNYMVDESIIAHLKAKMMEDTSVYLELGKDQTDMFCNKERKNQLKIEQDINESKWKGKESELEINLRTLIAYNEEEVNFDEIDKYKLIKAIDASKILDPACGSGAFPMGILHKLVYVLGKLDKNNTKWRELQKNKAQLEIDKALNQKDRKEREDKLIDINDAFEDNSSDYGRKLFLIENCIYGVDIQPIAVQISKLRFFVSLIVDQKEKSIEINKGIRPLPNLETKFVAANSLIGLEKPQQLPIGYNIIEPLQNQLQKIRHLHFEAKSRSLKLRCQKEDKIIRKEIAIQLKKMGFGNKDADKIAKFDIYDQNTSSDWFEPEWMFGKDISRGFNIIIGNPPYIFTRDAGFNKEFKSYIATKYFSLLATKEIKSRANQSSKINLFALFILRGVLENSQKGTLCYIVPNNLLRTTTYDLIRRYLLENSKVEEIVDLGSSVFDNVTASTIIIRISKRKDSLNHFLNIITEVLDLEKREFKITKIPQSQFIKNESYTINIYSNNNIEKIKYQMNRSQIYLRDNFIVCAGGIATGPDKLESISKYKINDIYKPLIEGKDVKPYYLNYRGLFIEYDRKKLYRAREEFIFLLPEKLITQRIGGGNNPLIVAYDDKQFYTFNSTNSIYPNNKSKFQIKYLLAIINSKLLNWYYSTQFSNQSSLTVNISKTFLDKLPMVNISKEQEDILITIVDYILVLKKNGVEEYYTFFKQLIDAIVYEIYLIESIKEANCEILKYLNDLEHIIKGEDTKNKSIISTSYKKLSDINHPVSISIFKMDSIEEIAIIEGKK